MAQGKKQFMFVIRKIHSAYVVSGDENEVRVELIGEGTPVAASPIICSTMQMVGLSKLILNHPDDPSQFLKDYYFNLGWDIENAD